jgi:toxin ParE1/3/4
MKPFVLTPRAEQDLNEIWEYIADDNVEAADRVVRAWNEPSASSPVAGHRPSERRPRRRRHRFFLVYSYLIVYRPETKPLQVIRVLHAARDVQTLLGFSAMEP